MRIFHPRPQSGRQKFIGVDFRNGVAVVDELHPERRVALEQHGYAIQDDNGTVTLPTGWAGPLPEALQQADPHSTPLPEPMPLLDLSVAELREIARFEGIDLPAKAKKADIIEALAKNALPDGGIYATAPVIAEPDVPEAFLPYAANED